MSEQVKVNINEESVESVDAGNIARSLTILNLFKLIQDVGKREETRFLAGKPEQYEGFIQIAIKPDAQGRYLIHGGNDAAWEYKFASDVSDADTLDMAYQVKLFAYSHLSIHTPAGPREQVRKSPVLRFLAVLSPDRNSVSLYESYRDNGVTKYRRFNLNKQQQKAGLDIQTIERLVSARIGAFWNAARNGNAPVNVLDFGLGKPDESLTPEQRTNRQRNPIALYVESLKRESRKLKKA